MLKIKFYSSHNIAIGLMVIYQIYTCTKTSLSCWDLIMLKEINMATF